VRGRTICFVLCICLPVFLLDDAMKDNPTQITITSTDRPFLAHLIDWLNKQQVQEGSTTLTVSEAKNEQVRPQY
jgi:hypothetical protein